MRRAPLVRARSMFSILAILAMVLLPCCHRKQQQGNTQAERKGKAYYGVGVVESIDKNLNQIQINHEDIKDYMTAMSMPYHVKDKPMLDSVKPGDKVDFTLEDTGGKGMIVTEIKKHE